MCQKQGRETLFPWMKTVIDSFAKSFMSDYNLNILAFLHGKIDQEIQFINGSDGKSYTVPRTQALYIELFNLYDHMRLKINQNLEFPNAALSCVKLLSQIIKTSLLLTQGLEQSKWIEQSLTAIKFFTGKSDLIFDVLLLVNGLKKIYRKPYALILKCVLIDDQVEYITTDPLVYMKIILLFRRLIALDAFKYHFTTLVSKIKPPTNLISWLESLGVRSTSKLLKKLKYKSLAQQLIRRDVPESLLQKIRDMALCSYHFEASYDEYEVKEEDPLDMFIIDTSSIFENQINRKKLKSLSKKKKPVLNKSPEDTEAESSALKSDVRLSYLNSYSNLVVESDGTESVCESGASDTRHDYSSESDSCRFVLQKSVKKPKLKVTQIQKYKVEAKVFNKEKDSDSDSFFKSDVPLKKARKDISCENYSSHSGVSLKRRSINKNQNIEAKKDTVIKSRKKLKSCMDRKLKYDNSFTCGGGNVASSSNATNLDFVPPNKIELFNKQSSPSVSDGISLIATEITKKKSGSNKLSKKEFLKKQKSSKDSDSAIKIVSPSKKKKSKKNKNKGYSSDVTDKFKSEHFVNLSLEKKSVSQTSSPMKKSKSSKLNMNELLTNKRPQDSDSSSCKMVYTKKKISKMIDESSSDNVNMSKRDYFRKLSLEEKKKCESETPADKNLNSEVPHVEDSKTISENGNDEICSRISESEIHVSVELLETSENSTSKISDVESKKLQSNSDSMTLCNSNHLEEMDDKVIENSCILSFKKGTSVSSILSPQSIPSEVKDSNYLNKESDINSTPNITGSPAKCGDVQNIIHSDELSNIEYTTCLKSAAVSDINENSMPIEDSSLSSEILQDKEEINMLLSENMNPENQSDISILVNNLKENNDLVVEYSKNHIEKCTAALSIISSLIKDSADISKCNEAEICLKNVKNLSPHKVEKGFVDASSHSINSLTNNSDSTDKVSTQLQSSIIETKICSPPKQTVNLTTTPQSQSFTVHAEISSPSIDLSDTQLQSSISAEKSSPSKHTINLITPQLPLPASPLVELDLNKPQNSPKSKIACNSLLEDQKTEAKVEMPLEDNSETKELQTRNEKSIENVNKTGGLKNESKTRNDIDVSTNLVSEIEDTCNVDMSSNTALVNSHSIDTPLKDAENLSPSKQIVSINGPNSQESKIKRVNENAACIGEVEKQNAVEQIMHCKNNSDKQSENSDFDKSKEYMNKIKATNNEDSISEGKNLNINVSVVSSSEICNNVISETCTEVKDVCNIDQSGLDVSTSTVVESQNCTMLPTESMDTLPLKEDVCISNPSLKSLESNTNTLENETACNNEVDNQTSDVQMMVCDNDSSSNMAKEIDSEETCINMCEVINTDPEDSTEKVKENINTCTAIDINCNKKDLGDHDSSNMLIIDNDETCNLNTSVNSEQLLVQSQNIKTISDVEIGSPSKETVCVNNTVSCSIESDMDMSKNEEQMVVCEDSSDIKKSESDLEKSEENKCDVIDTCPEKSVSHSESLNLDSCNTTNMRANETEIKDENTCNINQRNTETIISPTEQEVSVNMPILHSIESVIKEPENLAAEKLDTNQESLGSKSKDFSKNPQIATVTSSGELELHANNSSTQLVREDENASNTTQLTESQNSSKNSSPIKTDVCINNPSLYSTESITNEPANSSENKTDCSTEFGNCKANEQIELTSHENSLNSIEVEIGNCKKSLTNKTEAPATILENSESKLHESTLISDETDLLSNSKDDSIDSSSHIINKNPHLASEIKSEISCTSNISKPSFDCNNSEVGFTCDNAISVIKENIQSSPESEEAKESVKKNNPKCLKSDKRGVVNSPLKPLPKIPTSECIPSFCENKSYTSFSDISLRDKDRSIEVDSGLKSPIILFSSAASAEIFSMYRNDKDVELVSRSDALSNDHEVSDGSTSQNLSPDVSDEEFDFENIFSDEDDTKNEVEVVSDCTTPIISNPSVLLKRIEDFSADEIEETISGSRNSSSPDDDNANNIDSSDSCVIKAKEIKCVADEVEEKEIFAKPRQSLRLRSKAQVKSKTDVEEDSEVDIPKPPDMSQKDILEQETLLKCNPNKDNSIDNDSSSGKIFPPVKTKRASPKSILKRSSRLKENSENCSVVSKGYSLRRPKSSRQKDDSSNLGVDLNKLQLDSPSSTKTTRSTRQSKFSRLLTLDMDSENSNDSTVTKKQETVSKAGNENVQNTPSYNLRNRKLIIDVLLQK